MDTAQVMSEAPAPAGLRASIGEDGGVVITPAAPEDEHKALRAAAMREVESGNFEGGLLQFKALVEKYPDDWQSIQDIGVLLSRQGRYTEAVPWQAEAAVKSNHVGHVMANLAMTLQAMGQGEAAVAAGRRAIESTPYDVYCWKAYAMAHRRAGNQRKALEVLYRSLYLRPEWADAHWNVALLHLALGEYVAGFREYEWRKAQNPFSWVRCPAWQGQVVEGTLAVLCEQGIGDTIQFARYLPDVKARVGRLMVICQESLIPLLQASELGVDEYVSLEHPVVSGLPDARVAMGSLPHVFGTDVGTVPRAGGYLRVPRKPMRREGMMVGICWAGAAYHPDDRLRSIPFPVFSALLDVPGVTWVSLQVGERAADLADTAVEVVDVNGYVGDYAATAEIIQELDLVITVDTGVLHLAGALGVPAWGLIAQIADWRWLLDRTDTPWYSSVRLFRNTLHDDWSPAIAAVREALSLVVSV